MQAKQHLLSPVQAQFLHPHKQSFLPHKHISQHVPSHLQQHCLQQSHPQKQTLQFLLHKCLDLINVTINMIVIIKITIIKKTFICSLLSLYISLSIYMIDRRKICEDENKLSIKSSRKK